MATEQQYYEFLARTDHPVFARDLSSSTDASSPFNSIMNRLVAKQLVRLEAALAAFSRNRFPQSVDELAIDQWEETHFGFTKPGRALDDRVPELLERINRQIGMSVSDVIAHARAVTGLTPRVLRNLFSGGWVLDVNVLDVDAILAGTDQSLDSQVYVVVFDEPVDSVLLGQLDKELTRIEKGGARHVILAPPRLWVLDQSALDTTTILG